MPVVPGGGFALPGLQNRTPWAGEAKRHPAFLHLKIQFFLIPQRYQLNLLYAMVFNL